MEWHSSPAKDVLKQLGSDADGLSSLEAGKRLADHGPNSIMIKKRSSPLRMFLNQFKSLLIILLILAALISLALSVIKQDQTEFIDAMFILAIVIANAFFGFFQENKAEKSIEALSKMAAPRAVVIRDGVETEIGSDAVVPGDILVLLEGDKVPADARIIDCFSFYCDESSLTGESAPVSKQSDPVPEKKPLAERRNMVFMNSIVTRGRARAVVVRTGLMTEIGGISREIAEAPEKVTQFQLEVDDIGRKVSLLIIAILLIIAVSEYLLRSGDLLFIFTAAVALGVAAIPEGLPAVVTLSLSIATSRMLKQNALMRRLATIQDLGSVDVICTDKTGTLTENAMTVTRLFFDGKLFEVTGTGYSKKGEIIAVDGGQADELEPLFRCAVLCNDAHESQGVFKGDPTEIALLIPAYKAGLDVVSIQHILRRVGEVSFSAERKMMSTANSDGAVIHGYVKGAPERVLMRCTRQLCNGKPLRLTQKERDTILRHNNEMAESSLRVLALAYSESPSTYDEGGLEEDLVFLGLMGMMDPPREGVTEAVEDCRKAGIRVIMVTGDNRYTAEAIGKSLGFAPKAMTGDEIDDLDEHQLSKAVETIDIFARTDPRHKVMLLQALKGNNHIVCMTGDGVNDAAAIKNSDVGVAMGIRGTEVTKQASDIIILDDNFITIRNAIAQGRGTFDNIRNFVVYLLGCNISEVLVVFLANVLSLGVSSQIAVQLLWINLVTDGLPAIALGIDPPADGVMSRKPRAKGKRMLDGDAFYFLSSIGISATLTLMLLYSHFISLGETQLAQTILFTGFVFIEMITVYVVRWRYKIPALSNIWLHISVLISILLQFVVISPPISILFHTIQPTISDYLVLLVGIAGYLVMLAIALKLEQLIIRARA